MEARVGKLGICAGIAVVLLAGCAGGGGGGGHGRSSHHQSFRIDPLFVAPADFDGDGRIDLAALDAAHDDVALLRNTTPQGTTAVSFVDDGHLTPGHDPRGMVSGDFDGDGKPDLAVLSGVDSSISVFLNETPTAGAIVFAARADFAVPFGSTSIAAADWNGDGKLDLAVAQMTATAVLLNTTPQPGAATFSPFVAFATGGNNTIHSGLDGVVAADIDGDGRLDLVIANTDVRDGSLRGGVTVRLNRTAPGSSTPDFGSPVSIVENDDVTAIAIGDLDGDGRVDVVAGLEKRVGDLALSTVTVFMNATTSTAVAFVAGPEMVGETFFGIAIADLDGDGKADIVTNDGSVPVFFNTTSSGAGTASFASPLDLRVPAGENTTPSIALADLDGDGRPEVIVPSENPDTIDIFFVP